ncbi:gamma-glutamyltranspeptidase / glutathione hydrolase [Rhizobiales bacterium GAS188]|jgi:gamma-glutamyltranspeptidase/glutathione hydrolase|nr:gamma-glutamyltranspeptidase / glutathione hydrolase [Rhizobiales bacterium GAS188]
MNDVGLGNPGLGHAGKPVAGLGFAGMVCEKQPATASKGMVVSNHPLASGAGAEMLLGGGNAIDAAVAALFALSVVEPMMVGVLGGGLAHIRLADGSHIVLDGISTAPAAATGDMYETLSDTLPDYQETKGRANFVGPRAMAVPGALAGWCEALARFGTLSLEDVLRPAIRLAEDGFAVTPYLTDCVSDCAADLAHDPYLASLFLPGGAPVPAGTKLRQPAYARTLRLIAQEGPAALYGGALGRALADHMAAAGGLITEADLKAFRVITREVIRGSYRGFEILGPPPPSSAGVHIVQMLNILEAYDIGGLGFDHPDTAHLLAESLKIAFADRSAATADPAFVQVPVERLTSKAYAAERRARIDLARAQSFAPGIASGESADTTHVTVADSAGNTVAATQTINGVFGARFAVPGTGMIANNYMFNFDPHPGHALSIAPGKRVFTSMAPMMALRDGKLAFALGLPGALRIFPSAMQAIVNLIDHGMSLQQAVEAPRLWTQGHLLELEAGISEAVATALAARGHKIQRVQRVAGGMNAISFNADGSLTGAACWRADGTPVGISGGLARAGVRFTTL